MASLIFASALLAATVSIEPTYADHNSVVGDTQTMTNIAAWASAVNAAIASGGGSTTTYPGTCRMTFTLGGELPTGDVAEEMLADANVVLKVDNATYRYPLTTFADGTTISTVVSVPRERAARAYVSFECPTICREQYLLTTKFLTLREGGEYAVPLTLRKADADLFAIGRGQRIDDTATMSSFLFTRDCASTNGYAPVTLFGYYYVTNGVTTWVNETGVQDSHPTIADGVVTGTQGDFETRIFPWAQAEKRIVYPNFSDSSYGNDYHFTWIPMYYWRLEDVTLPVRTYKADTDTWTTNSVAFRIHWISKSKLPGFDIPPWGYVHAYEDGAWTTKGVKDGFYYARYDSKTYNSKCRSKAFAAQNDGYTRHDITTYCHALNQYACTVSGPTATNLSYAIDGSNRLWAPPMYENYAPFRELAYIQFGASMKSTFYGGERTNLDSLETVFETAGDAIKSFATGSGTAANFAWLYIWNPFYGCEGSVMADASYVAGRDESGNEYAEWWVCPDRAADIGGATTTEAIAAAGGFALAYRYKDAGAGLTSRENARCIDETTPQSAIYWFPGNAAAKCSVRVTDESGWYGGAPAAANVGTCNVYGNWLSSGRGYAARLGLWCVDAVDAPSSARADYWGSRPSFAPVRAAGEAQSEQ